MTRPNARSMHSGMRLSDAQLEALSILRAIELNEAGPKSIAQIRPRTRAVLLRLELIEHDTLTQMGRDIASYLPDWDWTA